MQFSHVATITAKPGQLRDLLRLVERELLPLYRDLPGFVAYMVAKRGAASAVCFGIWQTQQQAEQAITTSDQWMRVGSGKLIDSLHNTVGDLPFIALTGGLGIYSSPAVLPPGLWC